MNQSENINELVSALSKAQGVMQAAIKDSTNPFFKSKYADLGSVWDAARPHLSVNGLAVMQFAEQVGDKFMLVTMLAHSSGQWIKSYLPIKPKNDDSQGIGAAITYMRRYGLTALVGVVCDDDDDGNIACGKEAAKAPKKPSSGQLPVNCGQLLVNSGEKTVQNTEKPTQMPEFTPEKPTEELFSPDNVLYVQGFWDSCNQAYKDRLNAHAVKNWNAKADNLSSFPKRHYEYMVKSTMEQMKAQEEDAKRQAAT